MPDDRISSLKTGPGEEGSVGLFGWRFVSETLIPLILELAGHHEHAKTDPTL